MSPKESESNTARRNGWVRLLGTLGMIASPMLLIEGLFFGLDPAVKRTGPALAALEFIYLGGWLSSTIGMRLLRVTGRGVLSKAAFVLQLVGLFLAALFALRDALYLNDDATSLLFKITDAAWPLSHLFMLVVTALVWKAGVWRGWKKFTPLLCGLALPLAMTFMVFVDWKIGGVLFGLLTTAAFMSLGYAVRTSAGADAGA